MKVNSVPSVLPSGEAGVMLYEITSASLRLVSMDSDCGSVVAVVR